MTAEQHTSIAHSDGDTPRVDGEPTMRHLTAIDLVSGIEFYVQRADREMTSVYRTELLRRLARPTPDQIRAALDSARVVPPGDLDTATAAVAALFDAEVGS